MSWPNRVIAFVIILCVLALPSLLGTLLAPGFEKLLYLCILVDTFVAGGASVILIAVPGLLVFDRLPRVGLAPRVVLGVATGTVAGILTLWFVTFVQPDTPLTDPQTNLVVLIGAAAGLFGTWMFWLFGRSLADPARNAISETPAARSSPPAPGR